jgi:lipopolysaccharide/colanic/teichoic acid biosynthesis glycosyltransferase
LLAEETPGGPNAFAETPPVARRTSTLPRTNWPARPEPDSPLWDALAPRGFYVRHARRWLALGIAWAGLVPAACVALPVALVTAWEHGYGKILFRQDRVGWRGRTFRMLKFRTLRAGEDDAPADARASRFGRFLRCTHLDELPQLVNVLRGEMDLVGPRPEALALDAWARAHVPGFHVRNALRPGLTGLAQVTQGYAEANVPDYEEKLRLDRSYLARPTFAADVRILVRTLGWVLRRRGGQALDRAVLRPKARHR